MSQFPAVSQALVAAALVHVAVTARADGAANVTQNTQVAAANLKSGFVFIDFGRQEEAPRHELTLIFRCISGFLPGLEALRSIEGALQYGSPTTNAESGRETAQEMWKYFPSLSRDITWARGRRL